MRVNIYSQELTDEVGLILEQIAEAIYGADPALRIYSRRNPSGNQIVAWKDAPDIVKERCRKQASAALTTMQDREATLIRVLEAQGLALAAWVNLLQPRSIVGEDGDPVLTGEHAWKRDPTHDEVQSALEAQNNAREALGTSGLVEP